MNVFESKRVLLLNRDLLEVISNNNQAIILQQVHFWLKVNETANVNYIEGYYWTQSSIRQMWERDFKEVLTFDTLKKAIKNLENENYLISIKKKNKKYYRINYKLINENFTKISKNNNTDEELRRALTEEDYLARDGGGKKYPARDGGGKKYPTDNLIGVKNTPQEGKKYPIEGYKIPNAEGKKYPAIKENNKYNNIYINNKYIYHHEFNLLLDKRSDDKINLFSNPKDYNHWFSLLKKDVQAVINEVLSNDKNFYVINGSEVEAKVVQEKIKNIKNDNIDYVVDKILKVGRITNFEKYTISALYNSVARTEKVENTQVNDNNNGSLGFDWWSEIEKR